MTNKTLLPVILITGFVLSAALVLVSVYSIIETNRQLENLLDKSTENIDLAGDQIPPSLDDQILRAQNKLRSASNNIRARKGQILSHAFGARRALDGYVIDQNSIQNIRNAQTLLNDIAENSRLILQRNEEIESETLRLYSLYQRKIETILNAKKLQKESQFGITFWAGLLGLIAAISGIAIAWRKDSLDHKKDLREQLSILQNEIEVEVKA